MRRTNVNLYHANADPDQREATRSEDDRPRSDEGDPGFAGLNDAADDERRHAGRLKG